MDITNENYKILGVRFQVVLTTQDSQGRTTKLLDSNPILLTEADFFTGLREFLISHGFEKGLTKESAS